MKSAKKFVGLGVVVSINLALQFLFQWYIIVSFGAGPQSDVFFGAQALPQFILLVLSGSLTMVLIPLFANQKKEDLVAEAWNYFQAIGLLFTGIAVVLLITVHWWVQWVLPGFKGANLQLAVHLSSIQLLAMVLSAMLSVVWAVHSAQENFVAIETTSIVAGLISLVLLFFAVKYLDIYAAAWISVLRIFLQIAFLMKKMGPWQRPVFKSASFKTSWKKVKPLMAGNVYYKTDSLFDKYLTSGGVTGDLTLLNLAQQLYSMASNILSKTFVSTIIPSLAVKAHSDKPGMHLAFRKRLWLLFIISVAFFLLVVVVGKPLLGLVFGLKNFDAQAVSRLWWILVLLFGFWFAGLLGVLTSGTFYAKGDTRTPTRIGVILFTLYLPVKFYVFHRFGIEGLALSISIYMLFNLFLQIFLLEKMKYV